MGKIDFTIEEIAAMVRVIFPKNLGTAAEVAVYRAVRQAEAKAFDRGVRQAPDVVQWELDQAFEDGFAEGFEQGQFEMTMGDLT